MNLKLIVLLFLGMHGSMNCMGRVRSWLRPAAVGVLAVYSGQRALALASDERRTFPVRPEIVQKAADKAFERNRNTGPDSWLFQGAWGYYYLLDIKDGALVKSIARKNPEQKDVYILEAGCGHGHWGMRVADALRADEFQKSGKHFHVISLTGGRECDESVEHFGNVTLYQFNQFKIENIQEELTKRGLNLENKVDLIVSRWTLRHLVDPWGTLNQLYGLLSPAGGKLLSNGFLFKLSGSNQVKTFPIDNESLVLDSDATVIFREYNVSRDAGEFLLERNSLAKLDIPLKYTSQVCPIGHGYQCAAMLSAEFDYQEPTNTQSIKNLKQDCDQVVDDRRGLYCGKQDQRCLDLYQRLVDQKLLVKRKS